MRISAIAVDDEPKATDIIEEYCKEIDFIDYLGSFHSPVVAASFLMKNKIDLLFLDIKMPSMTGFDLLNALKQPPITVITTAYDTFALKGFEYSVIDYLLKPFSFPSFLKSIEKALAVISKPRQETALINPLPESKASDFIFLFSSGKYIKVFTDEIKYIESMKDYLKVVTDRGIITVRETVKNMESLLPSNDFIRVHKSFIVAKSKIRELLGNTLFIENFEVPVGKLYRAYLLGFIKSKAAGIRELKN